MFALALWAGKRSDPPSQAQPQASAISAPLSSSPARPPPPPSSAQLVGRSPPLNFNSSIICSSPSCSVCSCTCYIFVTVACLRGKQKANVAGNWLSHLRLKLEAQTANSRSPHVHNTPESSCPLDLKLVLGVLADPQLRRSGLEVDLSRKQGRCHPRSLVALDSVIPKERRNPCLPSLTHPVACVKATCSADGRYLPNLVFRVPHTLEDFILQHQSLAKHQQTLHCWQPLGGVP